MPGTRSLDLGRHLYGAAAVAFGLIALTWHNYHDWDQLRSILNAADGPVFLYAIASAWIFGGAAIQFRPTAKTGAAVLGAVYLVFALLCVPQIVAAPRVYNSWGNFFEQLSLVTGAALVYSRSPRPGASKMVNRFGRVAFGICAGSFALEQAFYLKPTADLVPKWLPPGQMFWAVTTTVFFALAAFALLANRMAIPAARLLTIMILSFGLLVWIPLLLSHPQSHANLSETAETFAIAGTAWILADLLTESAR